MRKIFYSLLGVICLSQASLAQTIDDLKFYTEEYPPYNFRAPNGQLAGMSIEMLAEVLQTMGSKRNAQETQLLPWTDVYNHLLNGKNVLGFATTRGASREKLFKWAGPIVFSRTVLIGPKGGKKLNSIADTKDCKIAVIKNDNGHHAVLDAGVPEENIILALHMDEIIKLMEEGKANFWAYEETVLNWYLNSKNLNREYESVLTLESNNLSFAFSKDVPDRVVAQFQDALDEFKLTDIYFDILDRYTR